MPITVRVVGVPSDDQLVALGRAVTRAVTARLAEAERVLADRHGDHAATTTRVREPYDPARAGESGYAVPSYQLAGDPVAVPAQPAPATPPQPAPAAPAGPPPLPDLDANEAAFRAQHRDLADIDRQHKTARENEDAVRAVALAAFGSEDAVDAVFDTLSDPVKKEVDRRHPKATGTDRTAHRLQFFVRMRLYFTDWRHLLDHFRDFTELRIGSDNIALHSDAAERLKRVLDVLAKHGHGFPQISNPFGLHDFESTEIASGGFMIHDLGYAVDIEPRTNPRIGYEKRGPSNFDPYQIAASMDPRNAAMAMGMAGLRTVVAMGRRMAGDDHTLASEDTDPAAKEYFEEFARKFDQMRQGSVGFVGALSAANRMKLLAVRTRYLDLLRELKAARAKRPVDQAAVKDLEARRSATLAEIPPLVGEWVAALETEVNNSLAKHPGMDRLRPPDTIRHELKEAERVLQQARQDEDRARSAAAAAAARRDAAVARYDRARRSQRDWAATPAPDEHRDMLARQQEADEARVKELHVARELARATAARTLLAAELAGSDLPDLTTAWNWIGKVRELRDELAHPDLSTPAGVKSFESLTTGDLDNIAPADNPPLLRLLEAGFFNPTGTFDLQFFEEMAHSGFVPGATWFFGSADPMHFELQEGKDTIQSPGKPK
ncbi:hypothetical protein [Actinophytocola sp.]|uniref:hypothetical protein n=1 Tax=Actinophytocola sp. TaxID=1872138 RepID=UPI003899CA7B